MNESTPRRWSSARARESTWQRHFEALRRYRREAGHFFLPRRHPDPGLRAVGRWAGEQRVAYKRGELPPARAEQLAAIGFPFDYHAARWEALFAQLARFRARYGDCHVPFRDRSWGRLARWVQMQRQRKAEGRLDPERQQRLTALGFAWSLPRGRLSPARILAERPSVFLLKLERFHARHGHARPPGEYPPMPELPRLCELAARLASRGRLRDEAVLLLHELGFDFDEPLAPPDAFLDFGGLGGFVNALEAFHGRHGHVSLDPVAPPRGAEALTVASAELRQLVARGDPRVGRALLERLAALGFAFEGPPARQDACDPDVVL